jgi:hypothetical protein
MSPFTSIQTESRPGRDYFPERGLYASPQLQQEKSMKMFRWAAVAAALVMAGCASAPAQKAQPEGLDFARYHAVAVDSVRLSPEAAAGLSETEVQEIERQLHVALVDALPPAARAVNAAPGVLRVEVTVTDLQSVSPGVNAVTTALLFVPLDKGGVVFEARFYDETRGKLLAVTTQKHTSTPFELKGSFRRYGHAVKTLREWAAGIGKSLATA